MIGTRIGPYDVVSKLAAGGMGEVYVAQDTRLARQVAVKLLAAGSNDAERVRRFEQEARTVSALNHPHIVTIHEIGEIEAGRYIVMELVQGQTLRALAKPCPADVLIQLGGQLARALSAAHAAGITHRDIKPDNIMVRDDGYVKVLDFGLARLAPITANDAEAATLVQETQPGMLLGTVAYMSPEQARGERVSHATDIFSLGIVFYELVTGQHPFQADSLLGVLHALTTQRPLPPTSVQPDLPVALDRLILRMLDNDATHRPTAREVEQALAELTDTTTPNTRGRQSSIVTTLVHESGNYRSAHRIASAPSIAVLPFVNISSDPDNEYFCDGLAEELLSALAKVGALRVAARTSAFSFKGKEKDIRDIGRTLNVSTVLEGSVRKAGQRLRITAQLVNVADGYHLWSERYDRQMEDIFEIQNEIALAIVDALKLTLMGEQHERLFKRQTENLDAYHCYLKGLHHYRQFAVNKSIESFEQAIALDRQYAAAYAGLAVVSSHAAAWALLPLPPRKIWLRVKPAAETALSLDDALAEGHYALGLVTAWSECNWIESERHFRRAVELSPNDAMAHYWYAFELQMTGQVEEAKARLDRALELDPLSPPIRTRDAWGHWLTRDYDRAVEAAQAALDLEPTNLEAHFALGCAYRLQEKYLEAIEAFQTAHMLAPGTPAVLGLLGWAQVPAGQRAQAEQLLQQLTDSATHTYVSVWPGLIAQALGDHQRALDWYERAFEQGDVLIRHGKVAPTYDPVRGEPRFQALLRRMRLA